MIDYAQACGQQLALASTGLFRLEPEAGSSVGRWEALTLPPGFVTPGAFAKGRIHAAGSAVYVFKSDGDAARLSFEGCPSP
ncbi:MAG: hypothetical protein H6Q89_3738 [Myxococcaceae bacterium]|nr:hypothetical protein [Myxococcaceae bacterium]